jgi:hypothetical protein
MQPTWVLGIPRISLFLFFFLFFWEGGFFGALFEVLETIGPMIGEVGSSCGVQKGKVCKVGEKRERFKKGKGKVDGWGGGVTRGKGKINKKKKGGVEERVLNENEI